MAGGAVVMCCSEPNIKPEPFDIDHDPDGLSLRHDADGRLTARDGARVWTSVDQGRTWKAVEADCDGLSADWSWLPKVVGEMATLCVRVEDVCKPLDEVRRTRDTWSSRTTGRLDWSPLLAPLQDRRVHEGPRTVRLDGLDLSAVGTQAGRGQRSRAVPFTDTPGPGNTGERSGIMIEVPAEGWPSGWRETATDTPYRTRLHDGAHIVDSSIHHATRMASGAFHNSGAMSHTITINVVETPDRPFDVAAFRRLAAWAMDGGS